MSRGKKSKSLADINPNQPKGKDKLLQNEVQ